jgi:hypothetical protein
MPDFESWSTTAASNTSVDGVSIAEGMDAADVNNAMREIMENLAAYRDLLGGAKVTGGSSNAYTLTSGLTITSYQQGLLFGFEANHTNTGAATLTLDGIGGGAKTFKRLDGSDVAAGDLVSGSLYLAAYESSAGVVFIHLASSVTGKHTIWVPASAMLRAVTNGASVASIEAATNDQNYSVLDFDATTDEFAHFQIAMPKSWNEGTVTFQAWWTSTATDTDGVAWALQGVAFGDGDPIDTAWGSAVEVVDNAQSTAGDVYVSAESAAVTIAGTPAAGDICFFRVSRNPDNASDNHAEDARLIGIKILFTIDAANDA